MWCSDGHLDRLKYWCSDGHLERSRCGAVMDPLYFKMINVQQIHFAFAYQNNHMAIVYIFHLILVFTLIHIGIHLFIILAPLNPSD